MSVVDADIGNSALGCGNSPVMNIDPRKIRGQRRKVADLIGPIDAKRRDARNLVSESRKKSMPEPETEANATSRTRGRESAQFQKDSRRGRYEQKPRSKMSRGTWRLAAMVTARRGVRRSPVVAEGHVEREEVPLTPA